MSSGQMLLQTFGEQQVLGFMAVLARVVPLFIVAPLFSSRSMPGRVRGIAAVAIAIGLAPVVTKGVEMPTDLLGIAFLMGKEVLIGFSFAFVLACLFAAVSTAGTLLDFSVGFAFGAAVDPLTGNNSAIISQMYMMFATAIFVVVGGVEWVLQGFARTYDIVSIEEMPMLGTMVQGAVESFVQIFVSAIEICGPILLALIITDVAFGMVSRVAPSLNVFAVGFAVKIGVGLILLGLTFPFVGGWLGDQIQGSVTEALQTLKVA
ncbi:MAG: flagellar biosynthetic protein FliR [Baekduiaceae bacterium]